MEKQVSELAAQVNIGPTLSKLLSQAGIDSIGQLRELGSEQAFARLRVIDPSACYCKLYALEGAIEGVQWHSLPAAKRAELKALFPKK